MDKEFRRSLLISGLTISLSFLLFGLAFAWVAADLQKNAEKSAQARVLLAQQARLIETLARLKRNTLQVQGYATRLDLLLPQKDALLDFPRNLENMARLHQVALSFNFSGAGVEANETTSGYAGFSFQASGSFQNLEKFFGELEERSQKFVVAIDSFDLTREDMSYRASVQGRVFYK